MGWFLYDFVYYGTALNLPLITQRIFGEGEGEQALASQCWENIALNLMGLPGIVLAIWQLRRLGTKRLQSWGFVAIAASCLLLAAVFKQQRDSKALLFAAACVLIVSLNWGCNVSTYVLPAESFPAEVRSSFFGLSAAMGKFGAIAGTATFQVITAAWGFFGTFVVCAAVSLVGVLVTQYFVEPYGAPCRRRGVEAGSNNNEQQLERANAQVEVEVVMGTMFSKTETQRLWSERESLAWPFVLAGWSRAVCTPRPLLPLHPRKRRYRARPPQRRASRRLSDRGQRTPLPTRSVASRRQPASNVSTTKDPAVSLSRKFYLFYLVSKVRTTKGLVYAET